MYLFNPSGTDSYKQIISHAQQSLGEDKFGVAKGSKVKGRKKAPLHTSPWVDFLAFWRYMKSPGTQETESQARAAKIPTCDLYHKGGKACCEQMRGIF